jgi:fluoroacetyl-CoA thioesterase
MTMSAAATPPSIVVGLRGEAKVVVTPELTVGHFVAGMPEVYGTPFMIFLMETAAGQAIQACLPAGWVSVGVEVNIRHLAPTPVGGTVTAHATVTAVTAKLVSFDVEAHDGTNVIGSGTHSRAPIDLARFERTLAARSGGG